MLDKRRKKIARELTRSSLPLNDFAWAFFFSAGVTSLCFNAVVGHKVRLATFDKIPVASSMSSTGITHGYFMHRALHPNSLYPQSTYELHHSITSSLSLLFETLLSINV